MRDKSPKTISDKRREHNRDLIRRMRSGDSLKTVDSRASWFPPRPMIQKDQDAIDKLYSSAKGSLRPIEPMRTTDSSAESSKEADILPSKRSTLDEAG